MVLPGTALRNRPTRRVRAGGAAAAAQSVLQPGDLTYLGSYVLPDNPISGGFQAIYGSGLALRMESSDSTNPVHFIATLPRQTPSSLQGLVYEWRDATPTIPGSNPYSTSSYPTATVVKAYGDIWSGDSRYIDTTFGDSLFTNELDGNFGVFADPSDYTQIYGYYAQCYNNTYNSWGLVRSTLNYTAGTGAGDGPWRFYLAGGGGQQGSKSLCTGMAAIPTAYANSYLAGKRFALGDGGYMSVVDTGDCSLGFSLSAFDPPGNGTGGTTLTNTPLAGYWPHSTTPGAGKGRQTRPESLLTNIYTNDSAWPNDKFSWDDRPRGSVWIDTPTRRGVLNVGSYGRNFTNYLNSTIVSAFYGHYLCCYDPNDFTPVSGTARYDIQANWVQNWQFPTVDYSLPLYAGYPVKSVSAIVTPTAGASFNSTTACRVNCTGHGLSEGQGVAIYGGSSTEFNGMWAAHVTDPDFFFIYRANVPAPTWSGSGTTGTITAGGMVIGGGLWRPYGIARDPSTGRIYIGAPMGTGAGVKYAVNVYQGPV